MTRTNELATPETNGPSLAGKAKIGAALVLSSAAFAGLAAPSAKAEHAPAGGTKTEAAQPPRDPNQLPGIRIHLGRETLNKIKNSTIEIGSRYKTDTSGVSAEEAYSPGCTGVKVAIGGKTFIMTAAHCFGDITGERYGTFSDPANPAAKAENYIGVSPKDYAILDPLDPRLDERSRQPVAIVDSISIDTAQKDVALLQVHAADEGPMTSPAIRQFSEIPAINLNVAEQAPLQGTPVALFGEPQANGFEAIAGTGVYLGRVSYSFISPTTGEIIYTHLDLVGINPAAPPEDNCNYATSGSMALLPNGKLLGNLSLRTSHGFGPDGIMQLPDSIDFDNYIRPIWEKQLNVKLDGFSTICGYTVMDHSTPSDLIGGLKFPVIAKGGDPTVTVGKGGGPAPVEP
jgi:hypothetical protein